MDITSAVLDPELGCTAFTVERMTYTRSRSGTSSRTETFRACGCVHPGTPETLRLLPEEEKVRMGLPAETETAEKTETVAAANEDAAAIAAN